MMPKDDQCLCPGLAEKLGAKLVNSMPAITRGLQLSPFWSTTGATIHIEELNIMSVISFQMTGSSNLPLKV